MQLFGCTKFFLPSPKNHFGALDGLAIDQQGTDIDPGGVKTLIINHLVHPLLQRHRYPADNPTIDAGEQQAGAVGKDVSAGIYNNQCRFIEGVGPVG